jgi:hypothetical protein
MDAKIIIYIILATIAAIFFAIQLIICFKFKSITIKLIPVCVLILLFLLSIPTYAGVFSSDSYNAHKLLAILLAFGAGSAFVGDIIAWLIYGIYCQYV